MAHQYRIDPALQAWLEEAAVAGGALAAALSQVRSIMEDDVDAHEDAFSNARESWQDSDRGQTVRGWIDDYSTAFEQVVALEDALDAFSEQPLADRP